MNKIRNIFFLAALLTLFGCTKNGNREGDDTIRLTTSVKASSGVKAPVTETSEFTAYVAGWEPAGEVNYGVEPNWNSVAVIPAGATGSEITLEPVRSYHKTNNTYIRAWYPAIAPSGGVITLQDNDGRTDLLYTKEAVSGSRTSHVQTPLTFSHLLTQLKFEFIDGGSWDPTEKIIGITLKNVALPTTLDLRTGTLSLTNVTELMVPGISVEGVTVGATAVATGNPLMIMPLNTNTFKIDVQTSAKTFTDVTITTDDPTFLEGRAYTTTITLTKTGVIGLTATVGNWTNGTSSGAIVD